jgi:DNA-binding PadR family transcriptional regulator
MSYWMIVGEDQKLRREGYEVLCMLPHNGTGIAVDCVAKQRAKSHGATAATLKRLASLGLCESFEEPLEGRQDRRTVRTVYGLTEKGRLVAARGWHPTAAPKPSRREPFKFPELPQEASPREIIDFARVNIPNSVFDLSRVMHSEL